MYHIPVLLVEAADALKVKKGGLYLDGTAGGGGHSLEIMRRGGSVIAVDRDADAIEECALRFDKPEYTGRWTLCRANFKNTGDYLDQRQLDGAILDLGVSSHQIDTPERGMSYRYDGPLDMRMDARQYLTAAMVVNEYGESDLIKILYEYGEERFAKRIAHNILEERGKETITTTGRLASIIKRSVPPSKDLHPEKRTFQALRIEVNNELRGLDAGLNAIFKSLKKGARFCVITFHSLEDRIVKQTFKRLSDDCICDKSLPQCVCGHRAEGKLISRQKPGQDEAVENPRSQSATLRIIEKL